MTAVKAGANHAAAIAARQVAGLRGAYESDADVWPLLPSNPERMTRHWSQRLARTRATTRVVLEEFRADGARRRFLERGHRTLDELRYRRALDHKVLNPAGGADSV
jgi:hypothetical protein